MIRETYWESRPDEEIAEALCVTPANVRQIRFRAVAKLRKYLETTLVTDPS